MAITYIYIYIYIYIPMKLTCPATDMLLLFISSVTPTAEKVYVFLQRFKSPILPVPLELIAIVANGSPFSVIVRKYCMTHLAEDPAVERDTLNDLKSALPIRFRVGARGVSRTHHKYITHYTNKIQFGGAYNSLGSKIKLFNKNIHWNYFECHVINKSKSQGGFLIRELDQVNAIDTLACLANTNSTRVLFLLLFLQLAINSSKDNNCNLADS